MVYFDLTEKKPSENLLTLTYFMMTSLTTVGLGDFTPRSNSERSIGALMLLFSMTITSQIMEILSKIFTKIKNYNLQFDESNKLD